MRIAATLVLSSLVAVAVFAQQPPPAAAPDPKSTAPAPLSQVETLAVENLELKARLVEALKRGDACLAELGPLRTNSNTSTLSDQAAKLKKVMEASRPGFSWDWQKKAFVPVVATKAPTSPPTAATQK